MTRIPIDPRRRRIIRLIATGAALVPFCTAVRTGSAEAQGLISESDPMAVALKYKADATKAPERKDGAAFCDNCNYYTAKPDTPMGACAALGGRLVAAKGWCDAWEGY